MSRPAHFWSERHHIVTRGSLIVRSDEVNSLLAVFEDEHRAAINAGDHAAALTVAHKTHDLCAARLNAENFARGRQSIQREH